MLKTLRNQQGVALITALMLTLISLAIIMSLLYLVTQGSRMSASQKRYHNSLEASYAGIDFFSKDLLPRLIGPAIDNTLSDATLTGVNGKFSNVSLKVLGDSHTAADLSCLRQKLTRNTDSWASCSDERMSATPTEMPDLTFVLNGTNSASNFIVHAKIIDTQEGNTNTAGEEGGEEGLLTAGVVSSGVGGEGVIAPTTHYPYYYTMEIQGEKEINPEERAQLSVLYAY